MPHYYSDSSALVKLYVDEGGSDQMRRLRSDRSTALYTARVSAVEIAAAAFMRCRVGSLSRAAAQGVVSDSRGDSAERLNTIEVSASLADLAIALTERQPLRGYDAVQLAAALQLQQLRRSLGHSDVTFVCGDARLGAAAVAEGLAAFDPSRPS